MYCEKIYGVSRICFRDGVEFFTDCHYLNRGIKRENLRVCGSKDLFIDDFIDVIGRIGWDNCFFDGYVTMLNKWTYINVVWIDLEAEDTIYLFTLPPCDKSEKVYAYMRIEWEYKPLKLT